MLSTSGVDVVVENAAEGGGGALSPSGEVSLGPYRRGEWASRSFEGPLETGRLFDQHAGWGTATFQSPPPPRDKGQHWAALLSAVVKKKPNILNPGP